MDINISYAEDLIGLRAEPATLAARNFQYYEFGHRAAEQPFYELPALPEGFVGLESGSFDDGCGEDTEYFDRETVTLGDFLPEECWVKRYEVSPDEVDGEAYVFVWVALSEDGTIEEAGSAVLICDDASDPERLSGEWMENDYLSHRVCRDLEQMLSGVSLEDLSVLMGKPVPAMLVEKAMAEGRASADEETGAAEYPMLVASAYRKAAVMLRVLADEDGNLAELRPETYAMEEVLPGEDLGSTGCAYPEVDTAEEIADACIALLDLYTPEELEAIL